MAECRYKGFRHRRRLLFRKREGLVLICDLIDANATSAGDSLEHDVEQIWHAGSDVVLVQPGIFQIGKSTCLQLAGDTEFAFDGWRSRTFGEKEHNPIIRQTRHAKFPIVMPAAISLTGKKQISFLAIGEGIEFTVEGRKFRLG